MALSRKEKTLVAVLLVLVGIASFWAGGLAVKIAALQEEKPITVMSEQPGAGELEELFRLSGRE